MSNPDLSSSFRDMESPLWVLGRILSPQYPRSIIRAQLYTMSCCHLAEVESEEEEAESEDGSWLKTEKCRISQLI